MKSSQQRYTGTDYHVSTAYLLIGLIFCPALLALSRPLVFDSILLALCVGLTSLALAWTSWKRRSNLTILSIVA